MLEVEHVIPPGYAKRIWTYIENNPLKSIAAATAFVLLLIVWWQYGSVVLAVEICKKIAGFLTKYKIELVLTGIVVGTVAYFT